MTLQCSGTPLAGAVKVAEVIAVLAGNVVEEEARIVASAVHDAALGATTGGGNTSSSLPQPTSNAAAERKALTLPFV